MRTESVQDGNVRESSSSITGDLLRPRMPDGTLLITRVHVPAGRCKGIVALFPHVGVPARTLDGIGAQAASLGLRAYVVELRGHGKSGGTWSLAQHLKDYRSWLWTLRDAARRERVPYLIVAQGLSASLALLHEEIAHQHPGPRMPAVPDAMILLEPLVHGVHELPSAWHGIVSHRFGACHALPRKEAKLLRRFRLRPVRVQTPTILYTDEVHAPGPKEDALRRIFGAVRIRRVTWLTPLSPVVGVRADRVIAHACVELLSADRPHRFKVSRAAP